MNPKPKGPRLKFEALPDLTFDRKPDLCFDPAPLKPSKRTASEACGIPAKLRHVSRSVRRRFVDAAQVQTALETILALPGPGEAVHVIMGGQFTGTDLLLAVQRLAARPLRLTVATLSTSAGNAHRLAEEIQAGRVEALDLILSTYFRNASPEEFNAVRTSLAPHGCRIVAARNHAKVSLVAAGDLRLVVEGSGNLRSCNALEQATMFNAPDLYQWHAGWMQTILDRS